MKQLILRLDERGFPLDSTIAVETLRKLYKTDKVRRISNDPIYLVEIPSAHPLSHFSMDQEGVTVDAIKSQIKPPPFDSIQNLIHGKTIAIEQNQSFFIQPVKTVPANEVDDRFWGQEQIRLDLIKNLVPVSVAPGMPIGIAAIDTGIAPEHPALTDALWRAPERFTIAIQNKHYDFPAGSFGFNALQLENADERGRPVDDHHHGTLVGGVIGGKTFGVARPSEAFFPVKLIPIKAFDHQFSFESRPTSDTARILAAFDFVKEAKRALLRLSDPIDLRIVNMSFGYLRRDAPKFSAQLEAKVKELADEGILFVSAAGNEHRNIDLNQADLDGEFYPAGIECPEVFAVAASARNGNIWEGSNYGKGNVHIAAPGEGIYSTTLNDKFDFAWGTSLAAPFVSAAVALLLSARPGLTTLEAKKRLLDKANTNPLLEVLSGGKLDIFSSFKD